MVINLFFTPSASSLRRGNPPPVGTTRERERETRGMPYYELDRRLDAAHVDRLFTALCNAIIIALQWWAHRVCSAKQRHFCQFRHLLSRWLHELAQLFLRP